MTLQGYGDQLLSWIWFHFDANRSTRSVEEDASDVARDDNAVVVRSSLCIVLDYDEFVTIPG